MNQDLPTLSFQTRTQLRQWLEANHDSSAGIYVRLYKKNSGQASVSFEDFLDEGLCFGWSESTRYKGDDASYLQKFSPRRTRGTTSARNLRHAEILIQEGRMTPAGLKALTT